MKVQKYEQGNIGLQFFMEIMEKELKPCTGVRLKANPTGHFCQKGVGCLCPDRWNGNWCRVSILKVSLFQNALLVSSVGPKYQGKN